MNPVVVVERPSALDVPAAMKRAEALVVRQGWAPAARSVQELQFVNGRVRLVVQFSAAKVRWVFTPAAPGAVLPTQAQAEALVDGGGQGTAVAVVPPVAPSVDAARVPSSPSRRCFICATVVPAGVAECPLCGMIN